MIEDIQLPPTEVEPTQPVKKSHKKRLIIVSIIVLAVIVSALAGGWFWYRQQLKPLMNQASEQVVSIEPGSSATTVSMQLEASRIIRSSTAFELYARKQGVRSKLQAGTYLLKASSSTPEIVDKLVSGDTASRQLTIIDGDTLGRIRLRLLDEGYTQQEVAQALSVDNYDNELLNQIPSNSGLEGYIFPETYQTGYLQPPQTLIALGIEQMTQQLTEDLRTGFENQGLSVHQALTLASIIEREATANQTERRQIAQVFLSRLEQDEALGADITACYAAELAGQIAPDSGCNQVPLSIKSPYNTRLSGNTGLPPGPIGAPGKSAIEAVANPANTDFFFYFHGDDGRARFSKTYQQHLDKIDQFCQQNCG